MLGKDTRRQVVDLLGHALEFGASQGFVALVSHFARRRDGDAEFHHVILASNLLVVCRCP